MHVGPEGEAQAHSVTTCVRLAKSLCSWSSKNSFFWMHQSDAGCMTVLRHSLTKLIQYSVLCLSNWQHVSVVTGLDIMTEQFFLNKIVVHGKGVHCLCSVNCSGIWCELFKTTELHLYRRAWLAGRGAVCRVRRSFSVRNLVSEVFCSLPHMKFSVMCPNRN